MKDLFQSALSQEDGLALRIFDKYGHHPPGEIEWNFVEFPVFLNQCLLVKIGAIQYRGIQQVLQTRLKMTDEVAIAQHFIGLSSSDVTVPLQHDTIFRERAGFIRA